MGRVRGIIKIDVTFNGDATVDATIDVIGQTKTDCSAENIAETDSLVTFPDAPTVGDCVGDGIRTDGKDPTKYTIIKNDDGTSTVDTTIDVISQTKIDCSAEKIAETDSLVTFPDAPTVGDCVGDGIRTDGKDHTKYTIIKNDDGTLTFTSDGCPNLRMTKQSLTWLGTTWVVCAASSRSM